MIVLHVINGLGTGGAERSLTELVPALADRGIDGVIACLSRRAEGVEAAVLAAGVDVRFLAPGGYVSRTRELRRLVRELRPDVVHTSIFEADIIGRLAAAGTRRPVVTTLVNTSYDDARLGDPNVRRWRLRAVQAADAATGRLLTRHFVAITSAVRDAAVRDLRLPADRISVIPRGRAVDRLRAAPAVLDVPAGAPILLHVGRHEHQKAIDVLLAALPAVLERHPTVVLLQAGRRGNATAALEQDVERLGLAGSVRFLGHRDDVPALLAAADLLVFPSRYEGLGGTLIEAQAAGLPIVASDLPAVREVVEAGGTADLVPPGDEAALAAAILSLIDDPARRRRYATRGPAVFASRFTLEAVADSWAALLRQVAAR